MRSLDATSWLLDRRIGWGEGSTGTGVVGKAGSDLRLQASSTGRLSLASRDGSLGGLVLPIGMAFDDQKTLYLLDCLKGQVKRFEHERAKSQQWFTPFVLEQIAGPLRWPRNIAIVGNLLYVVDSGNARVNVYCLQSRKLLYIWGPGVGDAIGTMKPQHEIPWFPVDVATWGGDGFILDARNNTVYQHKQGSDHPCPILTAKENGQTRWTRIVLDRKGRIYLRDRKRKRLEVFDRLTLQQPDPKPELITDAGDVRGRFDPPPILMDHDLRFCLPLSLICECPREYPDPPPSLESPLEFCDCQQNEIPGHSCGIVFDADGNTANVDPMNSLGPPVYTESGQWFSERLDSQIAQCRWHRVEMEITKLPSGTALTVYTYTDEVPRTDGFIKNLNENNWDLGYRFESELQRRPGGEPLDFARNDFLVQSRDGQYLWLKIEFESDGYASPVVESVRVHYPRQSYLEDLPAVFSEDEQSRRFLENFLGIFQTDWDHIEQQSDDIAELFDPKAVGRTIDAEPALRFLSGWLGVDLEQTWTTDQQRSFLSAVPKVSSNDGGGSRRSTLQSIREYLQAYLRSMTGLDPKEQGSFPVLVEGFSERQYLEANADTARLGGKTPLWSQKVINRLQTDVNARLGEVRLVSIGDPARDYFHHFAHRFRVFLPAMWVRTREDENMIRRALDDEKPAHTSYELNLVEPRFRVGLQSTLGIDTLLGDQGGPAVLAGEGLDPPPSRRPYPQLGLDTYLSGETPSTKTAETQVPRLGINAWLREDKDTPS